MRLFTKVIACIIFAWISLSSASAATDVGVEIVNQATLTYLDEETGQIVELKSNTSKIVVAPLRQFELLSSNYISFFAGDDVVIAHRLKNNGNVDDRYAVYLENQIADSGDLDNLLLYVDTNLNGAIDAGEPIVDSELNVAAGDSISLLVTGVIPDSLNGNDEVKVLLHALAVDSELDKQTNVDLINIFPRADVEVDLSASRSCDVRSLRGDEIDFTLSASNTTDTFPFENIVIVDGEERAGVVLELSMPSGLSLVPGEILDVIAHLGIPLVSFNKSTDNWMRYEHWNGRTTIDRFALLVPAENFTKGETVSVSFSLIVDELRVDSNYIINGGIDLDLDGVVDTKSKPVCISTATLGAAALREIRFIEPSIDLQKDGATPNFSEDADFYDAPVFRLNQPLGSTGDLADAQGSESAAVLNDEQAGAYRLDLNGVYIELNSIVPSGQLIVSDSGIRFALVTLRSALTGDELYVLLRETQANTNLYRSIKPVLLNNTISSGGSYCPGGPSGTLPANAQFNDGDDICPLLSDYDDVITVSYVDQSNGIELRDTALVEPVSRVFDSTSLRGIPDIKVSFVVDGQVQNHPITDAPLVYTTDSDGRYTLPRLTPEVDYSIELEVPVTYVFPSSVNPEQFESFTVSSASYGAAGYSQTGNGTFSIKTGERPPALDIPLDPANRSALLIVEKSAETTSVDFGETVAYSIKVKNRSDGTLGSLAVIDYPAYGFRYQSGSATFNGEAIADPQRLSISNSENETSQPETVSGLRFQLAEVDANSEGVLRYHMRATAGASSGNGINRANANATTASGLVLSTPTSVAKVSIQRTGVLSDQAILFGKVYVDSSCDNIQNKGEWPIGGVRLYLQDGTFVVTDEDGQYSLYGMTPGLHVIKLDTHTLPKGLKLKPIDTRQAADPESRFVELSAGDFHRADFASYCPKQNADIVFAELKKRNLNLRDSWLLNEATRFDPDGRAPSVDERARADTDGDLSQGMLGFSRNEPQGNGPKTEEATSAKPAGENAKNHTDKEVNQANATPTKLDVAKKAKNNTDQTNNSDEVILMARSVETPKMGDPEELVKTITTEQAAKGTWLWPQTDLSWDGRFMAVVKSGVDPTLYVNGLPVAKSQIGEQIINRRERAQLVAWYGVKLTPGLNDLKIKAKDSFGNDRVLAESAFRRPSAGVRLLLRAKHDTLEADGGVSTLPIDIVVTDANNNPAHGVYFVTLRSTGGAFMEDDLQVQEPGMQVRVENGRGRVHLLSTELTGNVKISARTGALDANLNVVQIAAARPLIGAGLIDIGGQWNRANKGIDQRANLEDGFKTDTRVALFLKGRIKNDLHLSLAYDSDKNKDTYVLRDLNPNKHYATYGDSSLRGVEAQSRSKLYVKVEKDKNSVMWGDYLTDTNSELDDLGRVQRTLTGINGVLENDKTRIQLFAAQESASRQIEELAGNGTSFLYEIDDAPIVVNSEVVERVVRDRNNPDLILEAVALQRYADYSIDFETGQLSFAEVIPTVDADLNPVFIRVSYDLNKGSDKHWVSGIRLLHEFNPRFSVGASLTDDQNPETGYLLSSVSGIAQLTLNTKITATSAYQYRRDLQNDADAQRVNVTHTWGGRRDYRTAMTWARSTKHFDNPSAGISQGRAVWRLEHRQPVGNTVKAIADASHSRSLTEQDQNTSASVRLEKTFSNWSASVGARHISSENQTTKLNFNTLMVGAEKRFTLKNGSRGSFGIDYEQDVKTSNRYRLGLSSRLQLHEHVSAYARYELEQGLAFQAYSLDAGSNQQFTAGLESDVLPSTKLYSEYRFRDSVAGGSVETASGIRGRYEIRPNLTVTPAIEVIDALQGTTTEDSLSVSVGVADNRNPNRKLNAQAEIRETKSSRYYGFRGTVAQRLSVDWTGLLREEFSRQTPGLGELTSRHRMTVGFAKRPKLENKQHSLYMANWKVDYGPKDGQDRTTYLLSTHQNRQIASNAHLSGRFGGRWTTIDYEAGSISNQVLMADLRGTFDIQKRWELDVRGGWLGTGGPGDGRYSFGFGLAWIAERNLRLGLRYNFIGFREDDLDEQGFNAEGVRLGLQMKFDEDWFKWLD